jgi:hypothetical protein
METLRAMISCPPVITCMDLVRGVSLVAEGGITEQEMEMVLRERASTKDK